MLIHFYKYQGAGNDFIIFDGRKKAVNLSSVQITKLCDRHFGIGADGVMILCNNPMADFEMQFFNPDGTSGMFCGNGGRCITMFAKHAGVSKNNVFSFIASDGMHFGRIIDDNNVALKMTDADSWEVFDDGIWINTGTSHFVCFKDDIKKEDILKQGKKLRNDKRFTAYGGTNVNFVSILGDNELTVRTYERGVENETLACGTGITASALVYSLKANKENTKQCIHVHTLHDDLKVEFNKTPNSFESIILSGPAIKVFEGTTEI